MRRYLLTIAAIATLLVACGGPPPQPVTPPPGSVAPTPATPEAGPTAASTPAQPTPDVPTPVALPLPAPLYVLELGQVARIERDGTTRAVLTAEQSELQGVPPIAEFTVSPLGTLAYVVGDRAADRLVVADARGEGRRTLYEQSGHELSDLLFTPDGETLLFRLLNNREPPDLPSGLYRIPVLGGSPELLRADDEVDDPVNPSRAISAYLPVALSPDGTSLLVNVRSLFYEDCTPGVMPAAGGEVARVQLPAGVAAYCGEATWSAEGDAILFLAGPADGPDAGPQLWRAGADASAPTGLLPAGLYGRAPLGMPGGAIRLFLARVERDATGAVTGGTFVLGELPADGGEAIPLGVPFVERLERALWAPDGSGAIVELSSDAAASLLRWVPADGGEPLDLPSTESSVGGLAWGP